MGGHLRGFGLKTAIAILALHVSAVAAAQDWITEVRSCVARKDFQCAATIVDQRLKENPTDLEAQAWRARLFAWTGSWANAKRQYATVLAARPNDADVLLGLADVQLWSGDDSAALLTLDRAEHANAAKDEIWIRRARAYVALRQESQARKAYKAVLQFSPSNHEALMALEGLHERRHELRIGSNTDTFNYTDAANTEIMSVASRWNDRWSTQESATFFQRFGANAATADVAVTYRFNQTNWATVTGGVGARQNIAPQEELDAEYGHGFRLHFGWVRGVESYALARNLWFSASRVFTIGTTQVVYLPHEWTWTVRITGVRTAFAGANSEWVPSGFTRLSWPISHRVTGNGLFALGAENFSNVDQIGHFSAHTYGGGATVRINSRQDVTGYVAYQRRTQGRTQTSVGLNYGIRF